MSRSFRKTPITGITTARSEAADKRSWHSAFRQAVRRALSRGDEVLPHQRDHSDPWGMSKDGKRFWSAISRKLMRK